MLNGAMLCNARLPEPNAEAKPALGHIIPATRGKARQSEESAASTSVVLGFGSFQEGTSARWRRHP